jgi:hypothetical protein
VAQVNGVYSFALADDPHAVLTVTGGGAATARAEASEQIHDRAYVFTVVNGFGDESGPSPASGVVSMDMAYGVALSNLVYTQNPDEAPVTAKRIYRTATGTESTEFSFVAEIGPDVTAFTDILTDEDLAETLPGLFWLPPSAELRDLTELPGGILAAHDGRQVWLCEEFKPYAWPLANRFAVMDGIVALAASQRTLFALTDSRVHAMTVESPAAVYTTILDGLAPCLGRFGVVSSPLGVLFPSKDGLYLAAQGSASPQNVTEGLINEEEWQDFNPPSFLAAWFDTTYMAFCEKKDGTRGALMLDFGADNQARMRLLDSFGTALQTIPSQRRVVAAMQAGNSELWTVQRLFEGRGNTFFSWLSKKFVFPAPVNMAALIVEGEGMKIVPVTGEIVFWGGYIDGQMCGEEPFGGEQSDRFPGMDAYTDGHVLVYGDGVVRADIKAWFNRILPLPAGYAARVFELKISSQYPVRRVAVAATTGELMQGAMS